MQVLPVRDKHMQIVPGIIDELIGVASEADNAKVMILCVLVGGLVSVLMKTGGFEAAARRITKKVKTPRGANLLGQLFCVLFFFDDYANALITGPVLRPIADKVGLSRVRLAYIVDSTAAPVAGIAVVSSWVAVEIAVIASGLETAGIADSAFQVFLRAVPYCFYCIFALVFMFLTSITGREFGPMLKAERRARAAQSGACPERSESYAADTGAEKEPVAIWVAFGSIALLVLYLVASLLANRGDTITLLLRSAFLSGIAAMAAAGATRILPAGEGIKAWLDGVRNIVPTIIVLLLAWSLAALVEKLGTVYFVVELIASRAAWQLVPAIIFVCCCFVSFAAGSYGCMFMVMPMAIPIACAVMENAPGIGSYFLPVCVACVLSGGIFGDHCSPMTDCTILAALGSGCDVMDHAVTQMPYAFTVTLVSILRIIPAALGFICSKLGAHFVHYGPKSAQLNEDHKKILKENCRLSGSTWEVTDEVADSAASLCWEEAWNRLTAMRGLLVYFTREKKQFSEIARAAAKAELESVLDSMGIAH